MGGESLVDIVENIMARWNAMLPLSERDMELLERRFSIDFNYNSNHMEGNTLTYGQTEMLLLFGKVVGDAEAKDVQEMTASNVALKMMTEEARLKEKPLTQNFIRILHKTLLREDYTVYLHSWRTVFSLKNLNLASKYENERHETGRIKHSRIYQSSDTWRLSGCHATNTRQIH